MSVSLEHIDEGGRKMLEGFKGKFEYKKLSPEEIKERGILGILYGPIADTKKPTRNGRLYPRQAWQNALDDPIFMEQLESNAILGELEHPTDRDAIDPTKACMCLAEKPKIGEDGLLYGTFHIIDLPNGRILKGLCDYGTKIGVSSRGNGDLVEDINGDSVDPNTFDLTCWDAVILPAVKEARMNYIRESMGNKSLRESLSALVENAKDGEKEIMEETIKNITQKLNEDINTQKSDNINESASQEEVKKEKDVDNNVSDKVMATLKESIRSKVQLENKIQKLQENLAVSDTKAKELENEVKKYKDSTIRLSKVSLENKDLKKEIEELKEALAKQEKQNKLQQERISSLVEASKSHKTSSTSLQESLSSKDKTISILKESINTTRENYEKKLTQLNEKYDNLQVELNNKEKDYSTKLSKSKQLVEKYKGYVQGVVDRYVESKAVMLGISVNEIKNRLNESYTLDDIDKICDDLQQYNLRISKLPFDIKRGTTRISMKESKPSPSYKAPVAEEDDCSGLESLIKQL